ncbi:hypothetical protein NQ318_016932 [Aromia moschata]|uniref:Uncharacterized protein n=1 Tax=Aromia moschata TaxID=1265417 RepID=A0AAV8XSP7_9CUCU|nr:hypothetical protein NQ318_016932 [Aromia moschata]
MSDINSHVTFRQTPVVYEGGATVYTDFLLQKKCWFMLEYLNQKPCPITTYVSDSDESSTPPDVREKATNAIENILPEK